LSILEPESDIAASSETEKENGWQFLFDVLETILLAVVLYFAIDAITGRVRVDGYSMHPTLEDGEFVLVNRLAYLKTPPQRGDIIVFHYPLHPEERYIKRVIGVPGDEVIIEKGRVTVNGVPLEEPYIAASPRYSGVWAVPENALFVLGDNRNDSADSHTWGFVPMENVIGKAVLIYWPPQQWSFVYHAAVQSAAP
jgi:signal peptidase I